SGQVGWPGPRPARMLSALRTVHGQNTPAVTGDLENLPGARHAGQLVPTPRVQLKAGAQDEVTDRPADQHLSCLRESCYAGGDVHGDPAHRGAGAHDLTGVQACSDSELVTPQVLGDRQRAGDGPARQVEDGEEPVTCGVDLRTAVPGEQ